MTVVEELLKPCEPIADYYWNWAKRLEQELDGMEEAPQDLRWLYMLLSFRTRNHVHEGMTDGRFTPEFRIGDRVFPHPSMFPPDSFPWLRDLAERSENIALQARTFDFLWEHQPRRDYRDAVRAADAYREVARLFSDDDEAWPTTVDAFDRALALACEINDRVRAQACRDDIVQHLRRCCAAERWAELRDCTTCLMAIRASKFGDMLGPEMLDEIASLIDGAAVTHQGREEHHGEMHFLEALCAIRRAQGDQEGERAVVVRQARSLHAHADREAAKNNWLVASSFYADAVAAYQRAGDEEMADAMKMRATEANANSVQELKPIEATVRLPREVVDRYIEQFTQAPDLATALFRLSADPAWLVDPDSAAEAAQEVEESAPLYSMIPKQVLREDRVAARAADPKDLHHYLEMQAYSQKLQVFLPLRHAVISRLREDRGLLAGDMMAHLEAWPLMPAMKAPFFRRAVHAYFAGDYVAALHLLVPHLEDLLRRVLRVARVPSRGFGTDGRQTEQVLGDVLRNQKVIELLGVPLQRTLLFVLTEEQGFNLRNAVAHGLLTEEDCDPGAVEVVLWLLLSLTVLRPVREDRPSDTEVAVTAYRRWLTRGAGDGRDKEDWYAAERDLAPTGA